MQHIKKEEASVKDWTYSIEKKFRRRNGKIEGTDRYCHRYRAYICNRRNECDKSELNNEKSTALMIMPNTKKALLIEVKRKKKETKYNVQQTGKIRALAPISHKKMIAWPNLQEVTVIGWWYRRLLRNHYFYSKAWFVRDFHIRFCWIVWMWFMNSICVIVFMNSNVNSICLICLLNLDHFDYIVHWRKSFSFSFWVQFDLVVLGFKTQVVIW